MQNYFERLEPRPWGFGGERLWGVLHGNQHGTGKEDSRPLWRIRRTYPFTCFTVAPQIASRILCQLPLWQPWKMLQRALSAIAPEINNKPIFFRQDPISGQWKPQCLPVVRIKDVYVTFSSLAETNTQDTYGTLLESAQNDRTSSSLEDISGITAYLLPLFAYDRARILYKGWVLCETIMVYYQRQEVVLSLWRYYILANRWLHQYYCIPETQVAPAQTCQRGLIRFEGRFSSSKYRSFCISLSGGSSHHNSIGYWWFWKEI